MNIGGRTGRRTSGRPHGRGGYSRRTPHTQRTREYIQTDDIGDVVITVGTDTSDLPESSGVRAPYQPTRYAGAGQGGSRSRAWSPERNDRRDQRGRRMGRGGRPQNDRGQRTQGGQRGGRGRRFVAPDLDIERFIETARREIAAGKEQAAKETPYTVQNNFASLILHPELLSQVTTKGYSLPTPIQDKAIPHVRDRKDVVGLANTGTGKTAAFLIPLIDRALVHKNECTLVVVPTRELATQIYDEFRGFTKGLSMTAAVVIGGTNIRPQIAAVRNARFVIGTPGRLKDLIERKALNMQRFTGIVLDEADRMLDMGFIPDIRFLMERMHHERHSLCFSATMPPEIERLVGEFLKDPITVSTKTGTTSHSVEQGVVRITEGKSKFQLLEDLLRDPAFEKVIVFGETKRGVERLARQLSRDGVRAESIHGNKSSNQRKRALDAFKSGQTRVLVATDVAARGLDITDVSHVINYDVPHSYEDYVHRIGRTGRGGKEGKALTFVGQEVR